MKLTYFFIKFKRKIDLCQLNNWITCSYFILFKTNTREMNLTAFFISNFLTFSVFFSIYYPFLVFTTFLIYFSLNCQFSQF